jgi:hypothetical protein
MERSFTDRFHIRVLLPLLVGLLAVWALPYFHPNLHTTGAAYLITSLLALAGVGLIVSHGHYLVTAKDEFQRTVHIQAMLWSIGATFTVTTLWGLMEIFAKVPPLPVIWVCPMFASFMGMSKLLVMLRYR